MKYATELTDEELEAELARVNKVIDEWENAPDEEQEGGGSRGEWMYERYEELTNELERRQAK